MVDSWSDERRRNREDWLVPSGSGESPPILRCRPRRWGLPQPLAFASSPARGPDRSAGPGVWPDFRSLAVPGARSLRAGAATPSTPMV